MVRAPLPGGGLLPVEAEPAASPPRRPNSTQAGETRPASFPPYAWAGITNRCQRTEMGLRSVRWPHPPRTTVLVLSQPGFSIYLRKRTISLSYLVVRNL